LLQGFIGIRGFSTPGEPVLGLYQAQKWILGKDFLERYWKWGCIPGNFFTHPPGEGKTRVEGYILLKAVKRNGPPR